MRTEAVLPVLPLLMFLAVGACGGSDRPGSDRPEESPVTVSLAAPTASTVTEADGPSVEIGVSLSAAASAAVTVPLEFSGSATRDRDYAVGADALEVPAGTVSGSFEIDVFRDFDAEGDETLTIGLGAPEGPAEAGTPSSVTLTLLDGGPADVETPPELPESDATFLPVHHMITGESVVLGFAVLNASTEHGAKLVAEWSTDSEFLTDAHALGAIEVPPADPQLDPFDHLTQFPEPQEFTLPLRDLAPNGAYFVRVYLQSAGTEDPASETAPEDEFFVGFATDSQGHVVTRCETPERTAGPDGSDPLFAEQWHLVNTGQTAFYETPGMAGADLRMAGSIGAGRDGDGVTLAVVDTGLETCHPDLAGNVAEGQSFNFAYPFTAGASATDPFNTDLFGDHGTSVAGVAAAVAGNGLGGRGVAPGIELVGFNAGAALFAPDPEEDPEVAFFKALGASGRDPDSASVDVFDMSYGTELPSENASEDFLRLVKMGTTELRDGRGALYVKAAGNEFDLCYRTHPLNRDIGCIGANADPDQNLPYLLAVGAFNADGVKSSYSSAGANLWVVGPAGEDGVEHPAIITTDQAGTRAGFDRLVEQPLGHAHPQNRDGDYMSVFGGTSSAAPAVAGAIAILLGVNPDLTWRDVKHVLAATARSIDPERARVRAAFNGRPYVAQHAWQTNAAGYAFHNWYGFGAVNVDEAVALATSHAPDSLGEFVESDWFSAGEGLALPVPDADGAGVTDAVSVAGLPDSANIEAVILRISVEHADAWDLGVTVTSPAGTQSVVNAPFNAVLEDFPGLRDWELMSNAFYGENPNGQWRVQVVDLDPGDTGELSAWGLRFHYGEHP